MQSTVIKIWVMNNGGYSTYRIIEREISAFQELYPNLRVEYTVVSWSQAWQRIVEALDSKQTPDIFQIGSTWVGTLVALNALMDISDKLKKDKLNEEFIPAVRSSSDPQIPGGIYAVPWFVDVRLLYYNKEILKKKQLTEASLDTFSSFEAACGQINGMEFGGKQIYAMTVPTVREPPLVHNIAPWIWGFGGDFLSADGKKAAFNSKQAFEGIAAYFDLVQKGYAPIPEKPTTPGTAAEEFFQNKQYCFVFEGSWIFAYYLSTFFEKPIRSELNIMPEQYGVAPVPTGPAGRFTFRGGSNLAISNFSAHPDEAWEFVKFLSSTESQLRHSHAIGHLPGVKAALNSMFKKETPEGKVLKDSYQVFAKNYPQIPLWGSVELVLIQAFYNAIKLIKAKQYTRRHLNELMNKAAEKIDYLLSL